MRARQRHLNARHAGAMFVLDARFIDQADNTAVSTWADRSGNGYDVSQATGANQPTLQTQEQGGSSIVRFDGTNDFLQRSDTGFPTGDFTHVGVYKSASVTSVNYKPVYHYGSASIGGAIFVMYESNSPSSTNAYSVSQYGDGVFINNSTGVFNVGSVNRSGTNYEIRLNGGTASSKSMTTATTLYGTNGLAIGRTNPTYTPSNPHLNGDIGTVMIFASNLATSLRRRLERGCGLTWKIACS